MLLSNFRHRLQQHRSDCLVACAEMVLTHLGIPTEYARLAKLLRAGQSFTPIGHLHDLKKLGLFVDIGDQGEVSMFAPYLSLGLPVIVGVKTWGWRHWNEVVTDHAVVIVGIDQEHEVIYLNDPFFTQAPIEMTLLEFEIGWEEKDRQYGIIALTPPELWQ